MSKKEGRQTIYSRVVDTLGPAAEKENKSFAQTDNASSSDGAQFTFIASIEVESKHEPVSEFIMSGSLILMSVQGARGRGRKKDVRMRIQMRHTLQSAQQRRIRQGRAQSSQRNLSVRPPLTILRPTHVCALVLCSKS